ncbi:hypothetical protein SQ11_03555 [Nitrosospira sp. NpAV]|nr:hypothetical protein SQ11_03555 [Nitrosospira sp. NpAV]
MWSIFMLFQKRLTPSFEHRLSKRSLLMVYGTFALGLAAVVWVDRYSAHPISGAKVEIRVLIDSLYPAHKVPTLIETGRC